jgi:hypothetical protein
MISEEHQHTGDTLTYEEERLQTIKENAELLASLGLDAAVPQGASYPNARVKPQKREATVPTRRSARIEGIQTELKRLPDDWEDRTDPPTKRTRTSLSLQEAVLTLPQGPRVSIPRAVDYVEGGGREYDVVQPLPRRFADGTSRLMFEGRWEGVFEPNLTPEEVFRQGAFGGTYYA